MKTTSTTPDEARTFTLAVDDAVGAVEELLRRPKEQSLFESAQVLGVLDRAERAGTLAASVEGDDAALLTLAAVCAGWRAKASSQPVIDAASVKGGLLLDLWDALGALRARGSGVGGRDFQDTRNCSASQPSPSTKRWSWRRWTTTR